MKSYAPYIFCAVLGAVTMVFADTSSMTSVRPDSDNSTLRFTIHGDGDSRLLLDSQTGETWAMRTVLNAALDSDPAPITIWFPIPQADSKLSNSIIRSRLSQLEYVRAEQIKPLRDHLAQQEVEYSADHPRVVHARNELEISAELEADMVEIEKSLLPLFDR